jgi:hypothetical protein
LTLVSDSYRLDEDLSLDGAAIVASNVIACATQQLPLVNDSSKTNDGEDPIVPPVKNCATAERRIAFRFCFPVLVSRHNCEDDSV